MPRNFHRRMNILRGATLEQVLNRIANLSPRWDTQETSGAVAQATNDAVPLGRELVVNPNFTDWTGDDPDGWSVSGEVGADPEVSEVGTGQGHGGVGTDACNFFSSVTNSNPQIKQIVLEVGKTYTATLVISSVIAGGVRFGDTGGQNTLASIVDTHVFSWTAASVTFVIFGDVAATDITMDSISVKQTNIAASNEFPGAELSGNPLFEDWTDDNPDWWSVTEAGDATSNVTENPTDVCQMISDAALMQIFRTNILTGGIRYRIISNVLAAAGALIISDRIAGAPNINSVGEYVYEGLSIGTTLSVKRVGACNISLNDFSFRTANPPNGDNTGLAVDVVAGGNLGKRYSGDGAASYLDLTSAEFNSILDPTNFHLFMWFQKDANQWDATERDILSFTVDASNWIRIVDTTTPGTISWQFRAGGTTEEVTLATGSPTTDKLVGISNSNSIMKAWYQDAQTGLGQAVAGTFVGNFVTMLLGARTTTPTFVHLGDFTRPGHVSREMPAAEWADIARSDGV